MYKALGYQFVEKMNIIRIWETEAGHPGPHPRWRLQSFWDGRTVLGPHAPWGTVLLLPISGGLAFPWQDRAICTKVGFYWGSAPRSRWGQSPPAAARGQVPNRFPSRNCLVQPLQPFHPRAPASPCRGPSLRAPRPLPGTPP